MPDWTDTLDARQAGALPGFLATDLPLEEQDEALGGARAPSVIAEGEAKAKADKAAKADEAAKAKADKAAEADTAKGA